LSNRPSTPRESARPGPRRRSGSSWPRRPLTGSTPRGACRLYGLRRGEVLGLRWSDIDLRAGALTVNQARVLVEYRVRIEEPKSRNGKRTLPLDGELVAALTVLRRHQLEQSTIAGAACRSGLAELDWYQGGEYVITDEAGSPVHPEWHSGEFGRLLRRAGLRRITLHDSRHTTLTLSFQAGYPPKMLQEIMGNASITTTLDLYGHLYPGEMDRYADRLDEAATNDDAAKMRPGGDEDEDDKK
jgi:integrase